MIAGNTVDWSNILTPLAVAFGGAIQALIIYLISKWTKRDNQQNTTEVKSAIFSSAAAAAAKAEEVKETLATATQHIDTKLAATAARAEEVKETLAAATQHIDTKLAATAARAEEVKDALAATTSAMSAKLDAVHTLVDGQKGILLENLAAALEANAALKPTPEAVARALDARKAADDHKLKLALAPDTPVTW